MIKSFWQHKRLFKSVIEQNCPIFSLTVPGLGAPRAMFYFEKLDMLQHVPCISSPLYSWMDWVLFTGQIESVNNVQWWCIFQVLPLIKSLVLLYYFISAVVFILHTSCLPTLFFINPCHSSPPLSIFYCCYFPHIIIHVLFFTLSIPLFDAWVLHWKLWVALYLIPLICSILIHAKSFSAGI